MLSDENGQTRVELSAGKEGPKLGLLDEDGKPRARLSALNDRPELILNVLYDDEKGDITWNAP